MILAPSPRACWLRVDIHQLAYAQAYALSCREGKYYLTTHPSPKVGLGGKFLLHPTTRWLVWYGLGCRRHQSAVRAPLLLKQPKRLQDRRHVHAVAVKQRGGEVPAVGLDRLVRGRRDGEPLQNLLQVDSLLLGHENVACKVRRSF
eukprot:1125568-Pyramimonas_sp.AAC.1